MHEIICNVSVAMHLLNLDKGMSRSKLFDRIFVQVKVIEKRDSVLTSAQQIDRLLKPGSSYLNLNPFEVQLTNNLVGGESIKCVYIHVVHRCTCSLPSTYSLRYLVGLCLPLDFFALLQYYWRDSPSNCLIVVYHQDAC